MKSTKPVSKKYFLRIGTHERKLVEVSEGWFFLLVHEGYFHRSAKKPHIADVDARYYCWFDAQTGEPRIAVKNPAPAQRNAVQSIFALILRLVNFKVEYKNHGLEPQYTALWDQHDQMARLSA